jgi:glutamine amidotransferase
MIGIVDYGMGNLMSVFNAFQHIGAEVMICKHPEQLTNVDRIVIPGVGAIEQCILKLTESGFAEALNENVLQMGKPTLGICLGMQVMATYSHEGGKHKCLDWFEGDVVLLQPSDPLEFKVPNIGWNSIEYNKEVPLFNGLPATPNLYLVHSFHMKTKNPLEIAATYEHGEKVTAAVLKNNIFATQFHPEKSQDLGLKILENFIKWKP